MDTNTLIREPFFDTLLVVAWVQKCNHCKRPLAYQEKLGGPIIETPDGLCRTVSNLCPACYRETIVHAHQSTM